MAAVLFVIVASCGGGGTGSSPTATPSMPFTMIAENGSGVTGTGQVFTETGAFRVSIKLTGLVPNSSHVSHVHVGSCVSQGNVAYALLQVVADSRGQATATSTVAEYYSLPKTGWYVNVHSGPDLTEAEYAPSVSCGDLPAAR